MLYRPGATFWGQDCGEIQGWSDNMARLATWEVMPDVVLRAVQSVGGDPACIDFDQLFRDAQ
eukprot:10980036-Alexandrium_andersonii.AAC.1